MHRPALAALLALLALTQDPMPAPPELGAVAWQKDFDAALTAAARTKKPVFLLFQEIPGCGTCTGFGRDVLGHALLAAAIEQCFVPVAVRNNVDGREKAVLQRFREPAWNNPVVRFLDATGKDLIARKDGVWDTHGIATRMIEALTAANAPVPGYLRLVADESAPAAATATATFAMHCFWEGEAVLGALDGVVRTRAAFADGAEVVEVTYLPERLARAALTTAAQATSCKPVAVDAKTEAAPARDQQHALGGSPFAGLDLSPMQRTKVHAALTLGTDPAVWLSPAQVLRASPRPR